MTSPILAPDAGPLITLAYADRLDLLLRPGWRVHIVDMVRFEVTRTQTPTSAVIAAFIDERRLPVVTTRVWQHYKQRLAKTQVDRDPPPRKTGLGELAIQEYMIRLGLEEPPLPAVFLFEDHKIARGSFHLPDNVRRVSIRAFLRFVEEQGWISSAVDVGRARCHSKWP
ncbi:MAG: hypothetical protein ACFCVA_00125 [Gammaproteobacteria bacterium]